MECIVNHPKIGSRIEDKWCWDPICITLRIEAIDFLLTFGLPWMSQDFEELGV